MLGTFQIFHVPGTFQSFQVPIKESNKRRFIIAGHLFTGADRKNASQISRNSRNEDSSINFERELEASIYFGSEYQLCFFRCVFLVYFASEKKQYQIFILWLKLQDNALCDFALFSIHLNRKCIEIRDSPEYCILKQPQNMCKYFN